VGFLGAGAILRQGLGVRGLTTAATLWLAAAIGVACGAGAYAAALIGGGLVLLVLVLMRVMTPTLLRIANPTSVLEIEYERGHGTLGPLLRSVEEARGRVEGLDVDDDEELRKVTVRLRAREAEELQAVVDVVKNRPEVHRVHLSSA
jgi:putative Mg2+ transporter-C (MgtC) family protein